MKTSRLLSLVLVMGSIFIVAHGMALAQTDSVPHEFRICLGDFALCAASTCKPDGNKIAVNHTSTLFDEAQCTCPILPRRLYRRCGWRKYEGELPTATGQRNLVAIFTKGSYPAGDQQLEEAWTGGRLTRVRLPRHSRE